MRQQEPIRACLLVFCACLFFINISAQNRTRFFYLLKRDKIIQPRQSYIDSLPDLIASRGPLPRYNYRENEVTKKVRLVYRNTRDNSTKEMYICTPHIRCNVSLNNGVPILDIWQIKYKQSGDRPTLESCISTNTKLSGYRFELDLSRDSVGAPTRLFRMPFRARTWGVGTVPFRVRFPVDSTPASVSASIGLIVNYGFTFGFAEISSRSIVHYSVTIGPFIGLSSADLRRETVKDPKQLKANQTNVAFSYGINTIWARNNLGVVISLGFDSNVGRNSDLWIYQHKPWFGLGVNVGLGYF